MWVWKGTPHTEERLTEKQFKEILSIGGFGVRNTYGFDCNEVTNFWYLIKDQNDDISSLPKKIKQYIAKADNAFEIKQISRELMKKEGYDVYLSAFHHYKIQEGIIPYDTYMKLMDVPEYEFWGCIFKETGKLEAYMICRKIGDICQKVASKTNPEYLPKYYPMYGLNYHVHNYYFTQSNVKYILSGARTITQHSNIQNFLIEKFNYRKAYCHLKIYYKWYIRIIISILYPFRRFITFRSVKALLEMHGMQG